MGNEIEIIKAIEQKIRKKLKPCDEPSVMDWSARKTYVIDDQGNLTGLNLYYCHLSETSFLEEFYNLTQLDLKFA